MNITASFIPALERLRQLGKVFSPRIRDVLGDGPGATALGGAGSNVLGFDTARSIGQA